MTSKIPLKSLDPDKTNAKEDNKEKFTANLIANFVAAEKAFVQGVIDELTALIARRAELPPGDFVKLKKVATEISTRLQNAINAEDFGESNANLEHYPQLWTNSSRLFATQFRVNPLIEKSPTSLHHEVANLLKTALTEVKNTRPYDVYRDEVRVLLEKALGKHELLRKDIKRKFINSAKQQSAKIAIKSIKDIKSIVSSEIGPMNIQLDNTPLLGTNRKDNELKGKLNKIQAKLAWLYSLRSERYQGEKQKKEGEPERKQRERVEQEEITLLETRSHCLQAHKAIRQLQKDYDEVEKLLREKLSEKNKAELKKASDDVRQACTFGKLFIDSIYKDPPRYSRTEKVLGVASVAAGVGALIMVGLLIGSAVFPPLALALLPALAAIKYCTLLSLVPVVLGPIVDIARNAFYRRFPAFSDVVSVVAAAVMSSVFLTVPRLVGGAFKFLGKAIATRIAFKTADTSIELSPINPVLKNLYVTNYVTSAKRDADTPKTRAQVHGYRSVPLAAAREMIVTNSTDKSLETAAKSHFIDKTQWSIDKKRAYLYQNEEGTWKAVGSDRLDIISWNRYGFFQTGFGCSPKARDIKQAVMDYRQLPADAEVGAIKAKLGDIGKAITAWEATQSPPNKPSRRAGSVNALKNRVEQELGRLDKIEMKKAEQVNNEVINNGSINGDREESKLPALRMIQVY